MAHHDPNSEGALQRPRLNRYNDLMDDISRRRIGLLAENIDSEVVQEAEPDSEQVAAWGLEIAGLARGMLQRRDPPEWTINRPLCGRLIGSGAS
jgi:hypothetical protein